MRPLLPIAAILLALPLGGCLKRTIQVTSEPPGALVWINDVEVGRTPLQTDFTHYGTYDLRVRREGYEPIITKEKAGTPVHELPPIDLLADAAPINFKNTIRWHYVLSPVAETSMPKEQAEQELIARAKELRTQIAPPPPPAPPAEPAAPSESK